MNESSSGHGMTPPSDPMLSNGGDDDRPRTRHRGRVAVILVAVLAVVGIGAGAAVFMDQRAEAIAAAKKAEAERRAEARERREERAAAAAIRRANQAAYEACADEMSPLLDDLSTLDARLDVGLDLDEYSDLLGNASVSYDAMDIDAPEPDCISDVGVPLENALNRYIDIASTWNDCIWEDTYCTMDDIDAEMQLAWKRSSRLIEKASANLDDLDPSTAGQV